MIDGQWEKREFDALQSLQEEFKGFAQALGGDMEKFVPMRQWPLFQQFVLHKLAELQAHREASDVERQGKGWAVVSMRDDERGNTAFRVLTVARTRAGAEAEAEKLRGREKGLIEVVETELL